jgi:hypothetical protein
MGIWALKAKPAVPLLVTSMQKPEQGKLTVYASTAASPEPRLRFVKVAA